MTESSIDQNAADDVLTLERRKADRRVSKATEAEGSAGNLDTGVVSEPRRKNNAVANIDPTTCERDCVILKSSSCERWMTTSVTLVVCSQLAAKYSK